MTAPLSLSAKAPLWLGFGSLCALLFGFGLWAMTSRLAGAVIAPGRIEVQHNRALVQHPDGGVVAEVLVQDGEMVTKGRVLVRLDDSRLTPELASARSQLHETRARRARLEAEQDGLVQFDVPASLKDAMKDPQAAEQLDGQRRLFAARAETLQRSHAQLDERMLQYSAVGRGSLLQIQALQHQLSLIDQERQDQKTLFDKGLAQNSRLLALQREGARLQGLIGELSAARAQSAAQIAEIALEKLRLDANRREEANTQLRDIGANEAQLEQRVLLLEEQIAQLNIRAPIPGRVLALQISTPQAVLRAAEPVAQIIPQDDPLRIMAQISPLQIEELHLGQDAKLILPGLTARDAPDLFGRLTMISADVIADPAHNTAFYRAEITLSLADTKAYGKTLLPGMPVEVFIQTTAHSPMAYLLQPFTSYFRHALRES